MSKATQTHFHPLREIIGFSEQVDDSSGASQFSTSARRIWAVVRDVLLYMVAITPGLSTIVFGPMAVRAWSSAKTDAEKKQAMVLTALATPILGTIVGTIIAYSKIRNAFVCRFRK